MGAFACPTSNKSYQVLTELLGFRILNGPPSDSNPRDPLPHQKTCICTPPLSTFRAISKDHTALRQPDY